jgi:transposase
MDIWDVVRRWHDKQSISEISQALGYDRKTVRRYIGLAMRNGIRRDAPLPTKDQVMGVLAGWSHLNGRAASARSLLDQYLPEIVELVGDADLALKPKIAFEALCERHALMGKVSYSSFKRFARTHRISLSPARSTCRIEVAPGSEVQIDYGLVGIMYDPCMKRRRKLFAFIGTLSHSRHKYVELVFRQDQRSFVGSHVRMFEEFGCVPERVVLDNLKTGVIKPDLYDPVLNRAYRELGEHYQCFLDPCRVAHPKDKGKVERDVPTVRQAVRKLLVLYPDSDIIEINKLMRGWSVEEYGGRKHGTTQEKPYQVFLERERPAAKPLPAEPFEIAEWKQVTVHPDHYVQFNRKAYSVPTAYIGKKIWARATERILFLYHDDKLIKQHLITDAYRHTDHEDFPENVRAALDSGLQKSILVRAERIGPNFCAVIRSILKVHAFINLRKAQGVLALAERFDAALIDKASAFVLDHHESVTPQSFKTLLEKMYHHQNATVAIPVSQASMEFVRDMSYFTACQEVVS